MRRQKRGECEIVISDAFIVTRWLNRDCVQAFSVNKSVANDVTHWTSSFNSTIDRTVTIYSGYNQQHYATLRLT